MPLSDKISCPKCSGSRWLSSHRSAVCQRDPVKKRDRPAAGGQRSGRRNNYHTGRWIGREQIHRCADHELLWDIPSTIRHWQGRGTQGRAPLWGRRLSPWERRRSTMNFQKQFTLNTYLTRRHISAEIRLSAYLSFWTKAGQLCRRERARTSVPLRALARRRQPRRTLLSAPFRGRANQSGPCRRS